MLTDKFKALISFEEELRTSIPKRKEKLKPSICISSPRENDGDRIISGEIPIVAIQNVVSTCNLVTKIDIQKVSRTTFNSEFNPKRFGVRIIDFRFKIFILVGIDYANKKSDDDGAHILFGQNGRNRCKECGDESNSGAQVCANNATTR
jgi:hypothetical protein